MSTTTPRNRRMSSRTRPATRYAVSSDGTRIAYEVHGAVGATRATRRTTRTARSRTSPP
jgi:hypothetical protein